MKCAILENVSTTTKTLSLSFFVLGSPKTKSIEISSQGTPGIGKGMYKPWGLRHDFAFQTVVQRATNLSMSLLILSKNK
jgi:hypothetical protein